jgi:hypothetical protein
MSKFKMPPKAPQGVQEWVEGAAAPQTSPEEQSKPG